MDVGGLAWGATCGGEVEARVLARAEGIRCAAMKVGMLSPRPVDEISAFMDDCGHTLIPELNYEGQFANLVTATLGRPVERLNRVTGHPIEVSDILDTIRQLAAAGRRSAA